MKKIIWMALSLCLIPLTAVKAEEEKKLFFYNWTNYFPPDLIKQFEKETGIVITEDGYDSNETLLAKLQAGSAGYDVVVPSDYMVKILIGEGLLLPIDTPKMENFKNIAANFNNPAFDPGRKYSAPYMWGTTGLSYDTAKVKGGKIEDSWKEFFEPRSELAGKVATINDSVSLYRAAAFYLGIDQCTEDPAQAQKILDVLQKQKPQILVYDSDGTIDKLASGEAAMYFHWNGAAHRAHEQRKTLAYVYPKEGIEFWQDNLTVPKDAPHPENAKKFINWLMKPEIVAAISNFTGYNNGIEGSSKFMDASLADDIAVNMPKEFADRLRPVQECSVKARELRDQVWTKLKK